MSKNNKIMLSCLSGAVIIIAAVIILVFFVFIPAGQKGSIEAKYNHAVELTEQGSYEDASEIFLELINET